MFIRKNSWDLSSYRPERVSTADIFATFKWNWISIITKKEMLKEGMQPKGESDTVEPVNWHARLEKTINLEKDAGFESRNRNPSPFLAQIEQLEIKS
jgi:hypothetical protein